MKTSNDCILSLAYWGPIQYFTKFLLHDKVNIEVQENYQRKSYRNRCELYGPNGKQSIQVPVEKGSFHKTNLQDLKISYDSDWQKNHIKTIEAAYKSSPFYEYYEDDILPLYNKKHIFLIDLNIEILKQVLDWIEVEKKATLTEEFTIDFPGNDYRETIHPKLNPRTIDSSFSIEKYTQGFEQRHGFIENLSILDLIFNLGPESYTILNRSLNK